MIFLQSSGLEKMAHITLYFAANIQNNLNLAKYNIRYSAECVTFLSMRQVLIALVIADIYNTCATFALVPPV